MLLFCVFAAQQGSVVTEFDRLEFKHFKCVWFGQTLTKMMFVMLKGKLSLFLLQLYRGLDIDVSIDSLVETTPIIKFV